jgi:hypothetical protein
VALGQAELARDTTGANVLEVQKATRDLKGAARLEEIRASLAAESSPSAVAPAAENAAIENTAAPVDTTKNQPAAQPDEA